MNRPIGIFDSGVGGLTVAGKVQELMPKENIIYFADIAHVPYGAREAPEIEALVMDIMNFLLNLNVKAIIMACNTSSALVLPKLPRDYPVPVLGVLEPAVAAAVKVTGNRKVGVIANAATVKSQAHRELFQRLNPEIQVWSQACPKLVPLVESGKTWGPEVNEPLSEYLLPLKAREIDTLVLGCTHYPFLRAPIEAILGKEVHLVDPAWQTVMSAKTLLAEMGWLNTSGEGSMDFFASQDAEQFAIVGSLLLGKAITGVKELCLLPTHSGASRAVSLQSKVF